MEQSSHCLCNHVYAIGAEVWILSLWKCFLSNYSALGTVLVGLGVESTGRGHGPYIFKKLSLHL